MKRRMILLALLCLLLAACQPAAPALTPTDTAKPQPKDMILIPAGPFQMGCDPAHNGGEACDPSEVIHTVTLDAYLIDKYETTNALYALCVKAGGCAEKENKSSKTRPSYYGNPEFANYPLVWVNIDTAAAFCTWAGKRLPTEAEWEKAARGPAPRTYPWGDDKPTCSLANVISKDSCAPDTSAVGSYPAGASPYGVMDMTGNVSEFVSDWQGDYTSDPVTNPKGPAKGDYRLARGGSFLSSGFSRYLTHRISILQGGGENAHYALGFRCAADIGK